MKRLLPVLALLVGATLAHARTDGWVWFFDTALQRARQTGKPMLIDFSGSDWCKPCLALDRNIYQKPEFKAWAAKKVILLRLDYPKHVAQSPAVTQQNEAIARQLGVDGFPTVLLVRPDGLVLGRTGYFTPDVKKWLAVADQILSHANQPLPSAKKATKSRKKG